MADQKYEYVVVEIPHGLNKGRDRRHTEAINSVAAHGWRLVQVTTPDQFTNLAHFERKVEQ